MKYLVMIEATQADYDVMAGDGPEGGPTWGESDLKAMFGFMSELNNDLAESGEMLDAQGLAAPAKARTVGLGTDGRPVVTDGPYPETKELLAGFWVLECASLERVTEIAARILECPQPEGAPVYPVVIRQIMDGGGDVC
jgi:hypothetical protein